MRKKIFIALRMAGIAGQDKLSGIFRFLGEKHDWDITLVRTAAEFTPARMRQALDQGYDGFISCMAQVLAMRVVMALSGRVRAGIRAVVAVAAAVMFVPRGVVRRLRGRTGAVSGQTKDI